MDIVELMHANHALPGREAVERDAMLSELRRLLEQRVHALRRRAQLRLRLEQLAWDEGRGVRRWTLTMLSPAPGLLSLGVFFV